MPFTPTVWADAPATTSPMSAANFNNMSVQYTEAINSFEQDLFTPFVFSGLVATKDGTTLSQLDVTAGVAFLLQADSTLRRRAPTSSTQSTSGHPSTTLYLDLNPDGSWSWGTAHSGVTNHLTIASVTTDASANIATVTDARTLNTTLLSGMAATLTLPNVAALTALGSVTSKISLGGAKQTYFTVWAPDGHFWTIQQDTSHNLIIHDTTQGADVLTLSPAGTLTATAYAGPFAVDVESSNTVIRPTPTTDALIVQVNGHNFTFGTDGSLAVADGAVLQQGAEVALSGSHSAGQIALSYGSGVPAALATNEIYFQVS